MSYSDDQPRDDHGRWESTGGDSGVTILRRTSGVTVRSASGSPKQAPYAEQLATLPTKHAILTAENPRGHSLSSDQNAARNQQLRTDLVSRGYTPTQARGVYTDKTTGLRHQENPFVVQDMPPHEAAVLGQKYEQNGVVTHLGYHDLVEQKLYPTNGVHEVRHADAYTELPGGRRFAHDINWAAPIDLKKKGR